MSFQTSNEAYGIEQTTSSQGGSIYLLRTLLLRSLDIFYGFSIFFAIAAIMYSLFSIVYPVLSAMDDGRKRYAWILIKKRI
jgi:hypothetical protein